MKTLIFLMLLAVPSVLPGQNHFVLLEAEETALDPTKVYVLVGKQRQSKPTWAMVEENGNSTGIAGNLRHVRENDRYSVFRVAEVEFTLPNASFTMTDGILRWRGKKVEALTLEFQPEDECEALTLSKDSLTKNMIPAHKLVLDLEVSEAVWHIEGSYMVPSFPVEVVDLVHTSTETSYVLGVRNEDGKMCKALSLGRDKSDQSGKLVYEPRFREGNRFFEKDGEYYLDGAKVTGFTILAEVDEPPSRRGKRVTYF